MSTHKGKDNQKTPTPKDTEVRIGRYFNSAVTKILQKSELLKGLQRGNLRKKNKKTTEYKKYKQMEILDLKRVKNQNFKVHY